VSPPPPPKGQFSSETSKFREIRRKIVRLRIFQYYMVFIQNSRVWLKILMISVISCLKSWLFFEKKTRNLFRFFSVYDFLILWPRILCPSWYNIFKFFCWKERLKMQVTTKSLFLRAEKYWTQSELSFTLVWWISRSNVMAQGWRFYRSLTATAPTYPQNFSKFGSVGKIQASKG
jgi:hypothetical protein